MLQMHYYPDVDTRTYGLEGHSVVTVTYYWGCTNCGICIGIRPIPLFSVVLESAKYVLQIPSTDSVINGM